jgi:hypothetical protein
MDFVEAAGDFLDVTKSLGHVVEVCLCGVRDILILPVGKTVGKARNQLLAHTRDHPWERDSLTSNRRC